MNAFHYDTVARKDFMQRCHGDDSSWIRFVTIPYIPVHIYVCAILLICGFNVSPSLFVSFLVLMQLCNTNGQWPMTNGQVKCGMKLFIHSKTSTAAQLMSRNHPTFYKQYRNCLFINELLYSVGKTYFNINIWFTSCYGALLRETSQTSRKSIYCEWTRLLWH